MIATFFAAGPAIDYQKSICPETKWFQYSEQPNTQLGWFSEEVISSISWRKIT